MEDGRAMNAILDDIRAPEAAPPFAIRVAPAAAALFTFVLGCSVLFGWIAGIGFLRSVLPQWATMRVNTALCFLLSGAALWLLRQPETAGSMAPRPVRWIASAVGLTGLIALGEYAVQKDIIHQPSLTAMVSALDASNMGRMAPATAFSFLFTGLAFLSLDVETRRGLRPAQILPLIPAALSVLTLIGYLYGVPSRYTIDRHTTMAFHTALGFAVLSTGTLLARPDRGWVKTISNHDVSGTLARVMLPATFLVPILLGFLRLQGQRAGFYGTELGLALMVGSSIVVFAALTLWAASSLHKAEANRARTEEELRRHSVVLANMDDAVVVSASDFHITDWNASAESLYGWSASEVLGMNASEILRTQWPSAEPSEMRRRIAEEGRWRGEVTQARKDGTRIPVEISAVVLRDSDGRIANYVSVVRDKTERREAEEEIRRLNAKLEERVLHRTAQLEQASRYARNLIEASLDAMVTIGPDGRITDVNESYVEATGVSRESLIGTEFSNYFTEPLAARSGYQKVFADGSVRDYSLAIRHMSGRVTDVLYNAAVYKDDSGRVLGVLATARDMTERTRFERSLLEANRIKNEFLANMSHELRTPLNGIIGFAEFLMDEKPGLINPKQKEYLGDILSSGRHLLELVNDVLDLAKVEAGKMEVNAGTFSLFLAIDEVRAVARPVAEKKSITLTVRAGPGLGMVTLDQQKFKQVLYNLVSNGIKFTDDGGSVEISADVIHDGRFRLVVKDTGIGIEEADLKRLFREFEQLESGAARRYEGTGLGLALTRKLVELQDGVITVESKLGKGSTFAVELPLRFWQGVPVSSRDPIAPSPGVS